MKHPDKYTKYVGHWIPFTKRLRRTEPEDMQFLRAERSRLNDSGIAARICKSDGRFVLWRELTSDDIEGEGGSHQEWLKSIARNSRPVIKGTVVR